MDRIRHMGTLTINYPAPRPTPTTQEDEQLRRSRLAYAEAAVRKTVALLMDDLPFDERVLVARQHTANLVHRATVRTAYGLGTFTDQRVLALHAATKAAVRPVTRTACAAHTAGGVR